MEQSQALDKAPERTPAVIRTPDEYRGALQRWQEQNLTMLTPFANISSLGAQHGIVSSLIRIDLAKTSEEVYDGLPFLKKEHVALAKRGLRKLAEGLGISTRLEHLSVGRTRHYWVVKAIASYTGLDGQMVIREACMEWDLTDGSDRMKGWTANQITEARKHGLRACETRAINAAIRECGCGIKQSYHRDELAKPFVAVRVRFEPDMSNPEVVRQVTAAHLSSNRSLYGAGEGTAAHTVDGFADIDDAQQTPKHIGGGATSGAQSPSSQTSTTATKAAADLPPVEGAVRIAKTDTKPGETNGRKWTKYLIVDSNGVEYSTFDKQHFEDADRFKKSGDWVEIVTETNGQYTNIVEIIKAGSEPALPGMDGL